MKTIKMIASRMRCVEDSNYEGSSRSGYGGSSRSTSVADYSEDLPF